MQTNWIINFIDKIHRRFIDKIISYPFVGEIFLYTEILYTNICF